MIDDRILISEKEIIEKNRIIAEFMEGVYCEHPSGYFSGEFGYMFYKDRWYNEKNLLYHSSWDWIMSACKKFDELNVSERDKERRSAYEDRCDDIDNAVSCYDILPAFNALVNAIQWYNTMVLESLNRRTI